MEVQIRDLGGPLVSLIRKACREVGGALPYDGVLRIDCDRRGLDPTSLVSATDTGIHFNGPKLPRWAPGPNELTFCIYEEAAHFVIGKRGLPHGADVLSDFLQELFAAYVERTLAARHHVGAMEQATIVGIPANPSDPHLHKGLAKMLGYEIAGDARATAELDSWLAGPGVGHQMRGLVTASRDGFAAATSPEDLATLVVDAYRRAGE